MARKRAKASRRYFPKIRSNHRRKMTIPISIVAGFMPATVHAIQGGQAGGLAGAAANLSYDLTGYNPLTRQWSWRGLFQGWTPILAGVGVHKLAGFLGINRMLAMNGVPLLRI